MTGSLAASTVVVLVGTDHHPFDRLVGWAAALAAEGWASWFVQFGTAHWPDDRPETLTGMPMLNDADLRHKIAEAGCLVMHAGPGLLMDAAGFGHRPVVVPRDPAHGEHVDDHQLRFAARMSETGRIRRATGLDELRDAVRQTLEGPTDGPQQVGPGAVCDRLAALVDDTLARRHHVRTP